MECVDQFQWIQDFKLTIMIMGIHDGYKIFRLKMLWSSLKQRLPWTLIPWRLKLHFITKPVAMLIGRTFGFLLIICCISLWLIASGQSDWICFYLFGGRGEGKKAAECLRTALKEYNLKFGTILNDPDLASFRVLPEFKQLQEEVLYIFFKTLSG